MLFKIKNVFACLTYGDLVWLLAYSLNSESWMVKKGRQSEPYLSGEMVCTRACTTCEVKKQVFLVDNSQILSLKLPYL